MLFFSLECGQAIMLDESSTLMVNGKIDDSYRKMEEAEEWASFLKVDNKAPFQLSELGFLFYIGESRSILEVQKIRDEVQNDPFMKIAADGFFGFTIVKQ